MKHWINYIRLPFQVMGLSFLFYGTRYLDGQPLGKGLIIGGFVMLALALMLAAVIWKKASYEGERRSAMYLVLWNIAVLIGIGVYFVYIKALGQSPVPETFVQKALLAVWLGLLIVGFSAGVGVEWAFIQAGRGRFAESRRVARAGMSWLLVGLMLASLVSLNYVVSVKDKSWDWSYLKTAKPSESTTKVLSSLEKELRIGLFFSSTNEVLGQVKTYFDTLPSVDSKVKIEYFDAEINPLAAEEFRSSRNGQIVLKYGDINERIDLGETLASARKTLRNLDSEFQKTLLVATQKKKVVYFTRGHGEFHWNGSDEDGLKSIKLLESFLRSQNYTLRYFGLSEGSGSKVPDDADAVVVVSGNAPMLAEEAQTLKSYVENGGGLFVLLDMDTPSDTAISKVSRDVSNDPLIKMLAEWGVRYKPTPLANTTDFVAGSKTESDTWFLYTNVFTSHESISSLARNDQRAALITFRSGYLEVTNELNGWQNFETVRSLAGSFADENKNFKYDASTEKKNPYIQGVATIQKATSASEKKGKAVILSDANAVSDLLIRNQGNLIYFVEGLRWLSGTPAASAGSGVATSEEDIRIRHTKKEDLLWFYLTVVAVPMLVLGVGFVATRRARRHR